MAAESAREQIMDAGLLAIIEADETARRDVEATVMRAAERVDAERARRRTVREAAAARDREAHEALLASMASDAQREASARQAARDAARIARRVAAARAKAAAVAAYVDVVRRGGPARGPDR